MLQCLGHARTQVLQRLLARAEQKPSKFRNGLDLACFNTKCNLHLQHGEQGMRPSPIHTQRRMQLCQRGERMTSDTVFCPSLFFTHTIIRLFVSIELNVVIGH